MEWFGPERLVSQEYRSDTKTLAFTIVPLKRKIDIVLGVSVILGAGGWAIYLQNWVAYLFLVCVILLIVLGNIKDSDTLLRVDADGLHLGRLSYLWAQIKSLSYATQSKYRAEGLYADMGFWHSRTIVSGLTREQTEEMLTSIYEYFPQGKQGR